MGHLSLGSLLLSIVSSNTKCFKNKIFRTTYVKLYTTQQFRIVEALQPDTVNKNLAKHRVQFKSAFTCIAFGIRCVDIVIGDMSSAEASMGEGVSRQLLQAGVLVSRVEYLLAGV